jgi:hypothetical protein
MKTRFACLALLFAAFLAAGCGGAAGEGKITGKVTFKAQPLKEGVVRFYAENGAKMYLGGIRADGTYEIDHVPAGPVKIAIDVPQPVVQQKKGYRTMPDDPRAGQIPKGLPPEATRLQQNMPGKAKKTTGKAPAIPDQYRDPEKSNLTYEVKPGPQTKDIDLK